MCSWTLCLLASLTLLGECLPGICVAVTFSRVLPTRFSDISCILQNVWRHTVICVFWAFTPYTKWLVWRLCLLFTQLRNTTNMVKHSEHNSILNPNNYQRFPLHILYMIVNHRFSCCKSLSLVLYLEGIKKSLPLASYTLLKMLRLAMSFLYLRTPRMSEC